MFYTYKKKKKKLGLYTVKQSVCNCNTWPEYLTINQYLISNYQSNYYAHLCQPVKAMPSNFIEGY